ncbi:MAG: radical SAM protein [Verrucomicrobiales bacterium]|nr:radical SAM protein [Verrucomicrobiales bacterium]
MIPLSSIPLLPSPQPFAASADGKTLLKSTLSRCPICGLSCPAEVWKTSDEPARVLLERRCPAHGFFSVCIASDARFYWLSSGARGGDSRCCDGGTCCSAAGEARGTLGRNANQKPGSPFETLSTCLALIEIVQSCNLSCPTCYADSPLGSGAKVQATPIEDLKRRIQGVIDRKGKLEILQLSGGEPTLHPQFFELLEWAQTHPRIDYILVNTNGVRLAHDAEFVANFAAAARRRRVQLYLQFDGLQAEGQRELRGADLRATRQEVVRRAGEMNLPVTLAMTVTPSNLSHVWEAIEFGLSAPHIQGITFQPVFGSGRNAEASPRLAVPPLAVNRLNTADILLQAVEQSAGVLKFEDFTPLPCGDPNCATIGYLLRLPSEVRSVSEYIDFGQLQGFLKDRVQYNLADLAQCGCESEPLGQVLKEFQLQAGMTFRIMVKPFMDAWTWDQDRIDRCCTHVIRPDGSLDSFCRYYGGGGVP